MIAVIGGSGLTRLPELKIVHRQIVRTPYGLTSSPLLMGCMGSHEIAFLARHGLNHTLSPHEINYRANIWALQSVGVKNIVSISSVTSVNEDFELGSLVVPHDLIDYTWGRDCTFFEGRPQPVVYTDFSPPYNRELRLRLLQHAAAHGTQLNRRAVYGCLQGPRMPTVAEVRRYRNDGVDIVGMTGMPEAVLARELDMAYVHLCAVIGTAACNDNGHHMQSPEFRSRQAEISIEKIRRLLVDL
ncbi:S-methyl-5'-thioinosine phosphorylase [Uruburuella testudinis]|uniref:S-methyl-5'-thioinosine phosphorylase n=1 Tax=Uruburuella testudinis TaxID=1282863 RepID=A0ABY4DV66_9NEIS|nr:S-methyl-5'-thioinosine phosphorylase [Uruburuella testudinis]UOO82733.1 S-methyl-5'-thioinosine phosphorylase [Uruburuella testudinis]